VSKSRKKESKNAHLQFNLPPKIELIEETHQNLLKNEEKNIIIEIWLEVPTGNKYSYFS
jgi:hypothetical protein